MSGSLRALLVAFGALLTVGLVLDLAALVLLAGVGLLVIVVVAWVETEAHRPQTAAELLDAIRARARGAERELARRRAEVLSSAAEDRQAALMLQDRARREVERRRAAVEIASDLRWGD